MSDTFLRSQVVQTVTGSVTVANFSASIVLGEVIVTQAPITQVFSAGTVGVSGSVTTTPGTNVTGSMYVTSTGSLPVSVQNLYESIPALSTGIAQAPPANQMSNFPWTLGTAATPADPSGTTVIGYLKSINFACNTTLPSQGNWVLA